MADPPRWEWEEDMLYEVPPRRCKCMRAECSAIEEETKFAACAKCGVKFCSRECLVADWKGGVHKSMCGPLKVLRSGFSKELRRSTVLKVVVRIRMYAFPFFLCHKRQSSGGALFVQSNQLLEDFYFEPNVNRYGERTNRSVHVSFITPEEFDEVGGYDFELALARAALRRAVAANPRDQDVVALMKFRCGYVCVVVLPICPDVRICRNLASDYLDKPPALQLNLDEL
ncbi:hypothetical protein CTAYLR_007203 [Chrysophaeum taylorii]|uniref:MYND-type domain-containing protein n=1 Tax=Chrysophaeum taylorii TaxID=2483200 RepID=A0AAD7UNY3_9STRA|nr:hypothetical protein CTAYLR_007203 [Chrysophaeum taylorii]